LDILTFEFDILILVKLHNVIVIINRKESERSKEPKIFDIRLENQKR